MIFFLAIQNFQNHPRILVLRDKHCTANTRKVEEYFNQCGAYTVTYLYS